MLKKKKKKKKKKRCTHCIWRIKTFYWKKVLSCHSRFSHCGDNFTFLSFLLFLSPLDSSSTGWIQRSGVRNISFYLVFGYSLGPEADSPCLPLSSSSSHSGSNSPSAFRRMSRALGLWMANVGMFNSVIVDKNLLHPLGVRVCSFLVHCIRFFSKSTIWDPGTSAHYEQTLL